MHFKNFPLINCYLLWQKHVHKASSNIKIAYNAVKFKINNKVANEIHAVKLYAWHIAKNFLSYTITSQVVTDALPLHVVDPNKTITDYSYLRKKWGTFLHKSISKYYDKDRLFQQLRSGFGLGSWANPAMRTRTANSGLWSVYDHNDAQAIMQRRNLIKNNNSTIINKHQRQFASC